MTTSNQIDVLRELRDKQQQVWSSGDYNKIAAITVPVAEHLVEVAAVASGEHVLDVATGTGHVALAAARRSAVVTCASTRRWWRHRVRTECTWWPSRGRPT